MAYQLPPTSKGTVRRASKAVFEGVETPSDIETINQWRSAHGYVINNFQSWIKGHIRKLDVQVEFAQRLKRQNTVIDKLRRRTPDGNAVTSDLTSMHDLAGCRLIFETMADLRKFQSHMRSQSVMRNVRHTYRHVLGKYDYVETPKTSGYRGVHEVMRHFPRGSDRQDNARKPWDGLLGEIQLRTRIQHAWATAVEISDLIDRERTKFETVGSPRKKFFAISSEIIARRHEGLIRNFSHVPTEQLQEQADEMESSLRILERLRVLRAFNVRERLKAHNVLNLIMDEGELKLEVLTFESPSEAIVRSTELENDPNSINAVYVRSDNPSQLKSAYRNYFNDPVAFVELYDDQ